MNPVTVDLTTVCWYCCSICENVLRRTVSQSHKSSVCLFQTPTLIVYGALDTNLGAQSHKNLMQLPHHFVLKLEGARHACYMDKPREFHQGLIEFLSKLK